MGASRFSFGGCVLVSLAAVGIGCVDRGPVEPPVASRSSAALITDQPHGGSPPGFFFLSPVVPDPPPAFSGTFEARLAPSVRIDRLDQATGAVLSTVTTLTPLTAVEKVRRNLARELYVVRWRTARYHLSSENIYRLHVIVGDRELGVADVRVVPRAEDLAGIDTTRFVGVKRGDVLPVRFRIERKAVDQDEDGVFDWQDNCLTTPNATGPTAATDVGPALPPPAGCNPDRSDCDPQEIDCVVGPTPRQADTDGDGIGDACECLNVVCAPPDLCHAAATCDEKTGSCSTPPLLDEDGDGVCDATDACPTDPGKAAGPGRCGCGLPETDSDGDGAPDCVDACPADAIKIAPGVCGCGIADTDGDQDGVLDCNDACPADMTKSGAGSCGCGTPDIDTDGDGTADCLDTCPVDPRKLAPGLCGCSVADVDSDGDGVPDCLDSCPTDPAKLSAGVCGCGKTEGDTDLDGVADCVDPCPLDPGKQSPGVCGCGLSERDSDYDGTPDCHDACPDDRSKVEPGACGCGQAEVDNDGDGVPDCLDACPGDVLKVAKGACGCSVPDTDSDGDGVPDCLDACPADSTRSQAGPCGVGQDAGALDAGTDAGGDGGGGDAAATDAGSPDGGASGSSPAGGLSHVDITWMSIANVYYELGPLNIITDGYFTRIPMSNFYGGKGGLAFTHEPNLPQVDLVTRVMNALGGAPKVNLLLAGHSHFDHTFDTATWSSLTGSRIIGSRTTCFQARAQGIASDHCRVVVGGERLTLTDGVTMRVVRWNHSGDSVSNPEQHDPIELNQVPAPDPVTGGLHGGVAEDFPNGGGGRGFLFTVQGKDGPFSWFFQNSASPTDLAVPIVVDGVDYGAPIDNLKAAMNDAGLTSVDLWIGTGGAAVAQLVLPVINPKAYLPVHWDGLYAPFLGGIPSRYSDSRLATVLSAAGVKLLTPLQYMDKWRLDRNGVEPVPNVAVKQALGFAP